MYDFVTDDHYKWQENYYWLFLANQLTYNKNVTTCTAEKKRDSYLHKLGL